MKGYNELLQEVIELAERTVHASDNASVKGWEPTAVQRLITIAALCEKALPSVECDMPADYRGWATKDPNRTVY